MYELKTVDKISHHSEIRNILLEYGTKWRKSKTISSNKSNNSTVEYALKKRYIEQLRYNTPSSDSVLLYVDEKGPVTTADTLGGSSWSSTQVKIEKAQKIKGLLNVFEGAYDHTNDKIMYNAIKIRQQSSLSIFQKE